MGRPAKSLFMRWIERQYSAGELDRLKTLPTRQNEYGYDPFGFNREDLKVAALFVRWLYRHYFRAEVHGIEGLPTGRLMLVANHSGQLPFDGVNIGAAMLFDADPPRLVRSMVDRFVPDLPYVSYIFTRWGQILGSPDNCRRLLEDEECILVFPEGTAGLNKPFTKRYQLQGFGHGFMRLALATQTPIVPVAVVGAEEQAPAFNLSPVAKLMGVPAFPVMPLPPFFPIVPLPSRYHIYFGEPQYFTGHHDEDEEHIEAQVKHVRLSIESMLRVGLKQRKSVFL